MEYKFYCSALVHFLKYFFVPWNSLKYFMKMPLKHMIKVTDTKGYDLWSRKLCEGDHITCWICMRKELWSTCDAFHIFGLVTCSKWSLIHFQIVRKMNFDPLSIFDAMIGTKVDQNPFFRTIWKWIKFNLNTICEKIPKI